MHEHLRPENKNQILAGISDQEYKRLSPHLEIVDLNHAQVLYEVGGPVDYVYFPFNAMISLVTEMADGKIVEVGIVGKEGMSGLAALMGEETSPERAIVQISDGCARAKLAIVKEEFKRSGTFQTLLLLHARKLMRQISQTAACNASHTAEERLCRWLLMCHDRIEGDQLELTQEFIAEMLGTRRSTVSLAAIVLQTEGLVQYNRGHIKIIDRPGLEAFACECYGAVENPHPARRSKTAVSHAAH